MSVYGYFACDDCREYIFLGKWLRGTGFARASRSRLALHWLVVGFARNHEGHGLRSILDDTVGDRFYENYRELERHGDEETQLSAGGHASQWLFACECGAALKHDLASGLPAFLDRHTDHRMTLRTVREDETD